MRCTYHEHTEMREEGQQDSLPRDYGGGKEWMNHEPHAGFRSHDEHPVCFAQGSTS